MYDKDYERVQKKLDLNETLVWVGRPKPIAFTRHTVTLMLFGIPWCTIVSMVGGAFMLSFWFAAPDSKVTVNEVETTVAEVSIWFKLGMTAFFIPFVVIGLGTLFAPLWNKLVMSWTIYAVTTKRAMHVGRWFTTSWRAKDLWREPDRIDKRSGYSTIEFAYGRTSTPAGQSKAGFINIPTSEAMRAEKALLDLIGE